jgi:4-cresol dehydrogenase (hydroxylating)
MSLNHINQTIALWTKILGEKYVITDEAQLQKAESATFKTTQKILGILKPHTVEDIQKIVNTARLYKISLYTVSTGKNWGFGSRIPIKNNSFLLDLSRMNRIIDYNEELGYITVEPGVTQKQLYEFLKKKKTHFVLSTTGSTPESSIVGNICERGIGIGPYNFRSHYISTLEVILPSGKCIHTGFGRFANAKAAQVYPEGTGPSFNNIFIQSNLGIITKLTLFLAPTPLYTQYINVYIPLENHLHDFLKIFHTFNFFTSSNKSISLYNDYSMLSTKTQYPWDLTAGKTPLPTDIVKQLKKKHKVTYKWIGMLAINGFTKLEVTAQVQYFKSLTKNIDGIEISPLYRTNETEFQPRNIDRFTYWRMKTKPPRIKNPDIDGCGKIRLDLVVPFTTKNITEVIETINKIVAQFGYEPFIEIHCFSARTLLVITSLVFDRTIQGEDTKALNCHDTLLKLLIKKGYIPYRFNVHSMPLIPKSTDDYDTFQRTIKRALDPHDVFSPGRYEPKK